MADARDFYATLPQVLPVLLRTIVWDRDWLTRLGMRVRRTPTRPGVVFWTKPVVRSYSVVLTVVLVGAVGLCVVALAVVLAGALGDAVWLRVVLVAAMGMALATLAVRIVAGVLDATR